MRIGIGDNPEVSFDENSTVGGDNQLDTDSSTTRSSDGEATSLTGQETYSRDWETSLINPALDKRIIQFEIPAGVSNRRALRKFAVVFELRVETDSNPHALTVVRRVVPDRMDFVNWNYLEKNMASSTRFSVGKWLLGISLFVCVSSIVGCTNQAKELKLDTSSEETVQTSAKAMLDSLSDQPTKHARLEMAIRIISMSSMGNQGGVAFQDVWGKYHEMTADELIASKPLGVDIEARDPKELLAGKLNQESQNRMREIVKAMHHYHESNKALPSQFSQDSDGKPLLSWRVYVLPYIDNSLSSQFHYDEPWDSEHNIKLVEQMPECYSNPKLNLKPGHTVYVGPVGEGSIWLPPKSDGNPLGMKLRQISDGISKTAALIEVPSESSVIWSQPADFDYDKPGFIDKLTANNKAINVAAADASLVFTLPSDLSEEQWRLVFGANDGDPRDPRNFRTDR